MCGLIVCTHDTSTSISGPLHHRFHCYTGVTNLRGRPPPVGSSSSQLVSVAASLVEKLVVVGGGRRIFCVIFVVVSRGGWLDRKRERERETHKKPCPVVNRSSALKKLQLAICQLIWSEVNHVPSVSVFFFYYSHTVDGNN